MENDVMNLGFYNFKFMIIKIQQHGKAYWQSRKRPE